MWKAFTGLFAGIVYPLYALRLLLRRPGLFGYIVLPILVNIFVGVALYASLLAPGLKKVDSLGDAIGEKIEGFVASLPAWLHFTAALARAVDWLLGILLVLALFALVGVLLLQFATILGAPWYGKLSEELEKQLTGRTPPAATGAFVFLQDIWRAIAFEFKKIVLSVSVGILLFAIGFLPGMGAIAAGIGSIALAGTIVGLDFLDGPLERRRFRFRRKLAILAAHLPASGSFSLACTILIGIPLLNLLAVPLCVAAGTVFFCDRIFPRLEKQRLHNEN